MPHALTHKQKEYLTYIKKYIQENESSPRLEEIAEKFKVKSPSAHKTLKILAKKGYLYFGRDRTAGFFIRLIERAGSAELMIEVAIAGKVDKYGEVFDFPEDLGHFASVLAGAKPEDIFALIVTADIPEASIKDQDLLICDHGKRPQPGDIGIIPFGKRLFLAQFYSNTFDKDTPHFEMAQQYPIPEELMNKELGQKLNWAPLAYTDETADYFFDVAEEEKVPVRPIPPEYILATVLRLSRALAF